MRTKTMQWMLAALYVLAVGLCVWVYFGSVGRLPLAAVLCVALLPPLGMFCAWVLARQLSRRGAQRLENALAQDSARERQSATDKRSVEIDRLRGDFEQAVKALKASKLAHGSRRGSDALYRLPWYAIIGPPASGKTTVLRNSGLKFPYLPGTGARLKGVGGTRNCDWWLTNHAILLDTAGRWSIEDQERDEWLTFLDLLKKHRGARPLNGIIAAISIAGDEATSISSASDDELRELALRMRERLDEITGRLGVTLPVYLLFTKCDLIQGFVETFGDLSGERRKQIWGFTAPMLESARRDPGQYFAQQFELLRDELEQRALLRMREEVNPRDMPVLYEFPAQFGAYKEKLVHFVNELFDASAYRETPLLRGAYFTSGTQEGAPADLLFNDIASELQLRPGQSDGRTDDKSYFLHDMLMRVVFEDRNLATTSDNELARRYTQQRLLSGVLVSGALVGTLLTTRACEKNLGAIARAQAALERSEAARAQASDSARPDRKPTQVSELLDLERAHQAFASSQPSDLSLGLDQSALVSSALARYYQDALAQHLVRPLLADNQAQLLTYTQQLLAAPEAGAGADTTRGELRDALSLHLLLTAPRPTCAPQPVARKGFVLERLSKLWQPSRPDHKQLLSRYLDLQSRAASPAALQQDARAVDQARRALGDDDPVARVLERVIANGDPAPQTLEKLIGPSRALMARSAVQPAFSLEVWKRVSRDIAPDDFRESEGDWVFGCGALRHDDARAQADVEAFRERYLARYEASWRAFIEQLSGRTPASLEEAESLLSELTSRPGPLGSLFVRVRDNTELPAPRDGLAGVAGAVATAAELSGAARDGAKQSSDQLRALSQGALEAGAKALGDASAPKPVTKLADAFHGLTTFGTAASGGNTKLEQYQQLLQPVLLAVKAVRQDESQIEQLATTARAALDSTELLLRSQSGPFRENLRGLLVPVLNGVVELSQRGRGGQMARAYCDAVYTPFQRDLAGRFPFDPRSSEPASLAAFTRFFQPGSGSLWSYQASHLASHVSAEGGHFRFKGTEARGLIRGEVLEFLQRAAAVSQAFFPDGATSPTVPLRVRVRGAPGYTLTSFRVGTRTLQYDSGQETWASLSWPGEPSRPGASLAVTPYQGEGPRPLAFDNPWGLFMMISPQAGAQLFERSTQQLSVGWRPRGSQNYVKVDFASDDPRSPLWAVPFTSKGRLFPLSAPARISPLHAACAGVGRGAP